MGENDGRKKQSIRESNYSFGIARMKYAKVEEESRNNGKRGTQISGGFFNRTR